MKPWFQKFNPSRSAGGTGRVWLGKMETDQVYLCTMGSSSGDTGWEGGGDEQSLETATRARERVLEDEASELKQLREKGQQTMQ